ncbi:MULTISPECIES: hypothetical protein [unclassified Methanosarcina]|uniref:hypothetical protein n=1 Tax=unclassified Methanosarcina TaxID=2644672 RepID=UPI001E60CFD2|nr:MULTISPECIES: hypothetical protein [unclassified Methanosarcina]
MKGSGCQLLEFHLVSLAELCRVSREVRIFPLVDVNGNRSPDADLGIDFLSRKARGDGSKSSILVPEEWKYDAKNLLKCPDDNSNKNLSLHGNPNHHKFITHYR